MADIDLNISESLFDEPSWDLQNRSFTNLNAWDTDVSSGTAEISPAGQLHLITDGGGYRQRANINLKSGEKVSLSGILTIEWKVYLDVLGNQASTRSSTVLFRTATNSFRFVHYSDGLFIYYDAEYEVGTNIVKSNGTAEWQTYRAVIDVSTKKLDLYLDDSTHDMELIVSNMNCGWATADDGAIRVSVTNWDADNNAVEAHYDYLKIATGAPSGITEVTTLKITALDLNIDMYDSISITEDIGFSFITLDIDLSIYDSTNITENIIVDVLAVTNIDISTYDSMSIIENIENYLDALNLNIYDELNITENLSIDVSEVSAINISISDNLSIAEEVESKSSAGALPFLTQNSAWYDGTYYWRSWYDRTNQYIKFEYTLDPANTWTENVNARISDAGVLNDYSLMGGHDYGCIVYQIDGEIKGRLANNYPSTSFAFDAVVTILTDVSKTYKRPVVEYVASERYWVSATEFNGVKQYAVAIRGTAKNSISSWNGIDVLGDTNNEESSFTCISRIGSGKTDNVVCAYSEGSSLSLKHYSGGTWAAEISVATIKVGTVVLTESQNFDVDTDLYNKDVHMTYIKSNGTACANHYDGSLSSEVVLDANIDCGHAKLGAFGDTYAIHAWERPSASDFCDSYYCMEHLPTGVCSGMIFLRESTGICQRSTLSVSSASMDVSFLTWEQSDGLIFSVSLAIGDRIHEDIFVTESIVICYQAADLFSYEEININENISSYLNILYTDNYDAVAITEYATILDLIIELGIVYDSLTIAEYLGRDAQINTTNFDTFTIIEDFEKIVVSDELFPRLFTVVPRMRTFEIDKTDYKKVYVEV